MSTPDPAAVQRFLMDFQDRVSDALEAEEPTARFSREELAGDRGGVARPRVLQDGDVLEKAAVHFSHPVGARLPPSATERMPELAGAPFEAASVSLIVHPRNPYVPTTHANFRAFFVGPPDDVQRWWFGGGYDLTPYYAFEEDCRHWHRTAADACARHGPGLHERLKAWCDEYFYLPHRKEPRGIGGVFFDDFTEGGFDGAFALVRNLADSFLDAYLPILEHRKDTPYGERERTFQAIRRGRYAEFNLVYDRGTRYGMQSGTRIESVLASMPPTAIWRYEHEPEAGSPEADLQSFLVPRDWLADTRAGRSS